MTGAVVYAPREGYEFLARYRCKVKERNVLSEYTYDGLFREVTQRVRLQGSVAFTPSWSMQSTIDYCQVNAEKVNYGLRLSDRLTWTPSSLPFSLNGEFSWFRTTSFDARLYGYERGLLYAYNYHAYYGHGLRGAFLASGILWKQLVCTAKFGWTHYFDRNEIGSGAELIPQNHTEDLALQLRYKF